MHARNKKVFKDSKLGTFFWICRKYSDSSDNLFQNVSYYHPAKEKFGL